MALGLPPPQDDDDREEEEEEEERRRRAIRRQLQDERERRERDERIANDPVRRALIDKTHQREMAKSRNTSPAFHAKQISAWEEKRASGLPPRRGNSLTFTNKGSFASARKKYEQEHGKGEFMKLPKKQPILEDERDSAPRSGSGSESEGEGGKAIAPLPAVLTHDMIRLNLNESGGAVPRRIQPSRLYRYDNAGNLVEIARPDAEPVPILERIGTTGPRVRIPTKSEQEWKEYKKIRLTKRLASGSTEPRTGVMERMSGSSSSASSRASSRSPSPLPIYVPVSSPPRTPRSRTPDSSAAAPTQLLQPTGARPKTAIPAQRYYEDSSEDEAESSSRSRSGSKHGTGQGPGPGHSGHQHEHDASSGSDCSIQ